MAVITSLDKLRLVQFLFTTGVLVQAGILAHEVKNQNINKRFITLSANCSTVSNGSIGVTLHTSEPFFGSLYSRDYPSSCKSVGNGGIATKLIVSLDKDCGVQSIPQRGGKLVTSSDQENTVDIQDVHQISLYVQHDEHVQQVIDEQFLVQCWKGMAQGLVSYQDGFSNFVDKTLSRSMTAASSEKNLNPADDAKSNNVSSTTLSQNPLVKKPTYKIQKRILDMMVPMEPMTATPSSSDLITIGENNQNNLVDIGTPTTIIDSISSQKLQPKASGWMELTDENGDALTDSIEVGSPVSLVIRLKHMASMDTMLSTCTAHSGDDFYDLTNIRGCTEDPDILPNFKAFFNSRTGVKRLTSKFPMFKFPDAVKVIIRCTVIVCNKNCPLAKCDKEDSNISNDFLELNVLDKFYLDTFAQVHDAGMRLQPPIVSLERESNLVDTNIIIEAPEIKDEQIIRPLRAEDQEVEFESHSSNFQQVAESAASKADEVIMSSTSEVIEEDLLCLSPSRLALAFGILLVILLLALLASCVMWMRARSHLKRPKPSTLFAPRPPRPPPPGALVPAPGGQVAPRGHPFMVTSRGAPYIRVVQ